MNDCVDICVNLILETDLSSQASIWGVLKGWWAKNDVTEPNFFEVSGLTGRDHEGDLILLEGCSLDEDINLGGRRIDRKAVEKGPNDGTDVVRDGIDGKEFGDRSSLEWANIYI